jgi:hypothetical protein
MATEVHSHGQIRTALKAKYIYGKGVLIERETECMMMMMRRRRRMMMMIMMEKTRARALLRKKNIAWVDGE